jgi:hypothetical protein
MAKPSRRIDMRRKPEKRMYLSCFRVWLPTILLLAAPAAVAAADHLVAGRGQEVEIAQVFNDLPGVQPQDILNAPNKVVCEQIIERRPGVEPTHGPLYHVLNSCSSENGPVFRSPLLPRSLERLKRGLPY